MAERTEPLEKNHRDQMASIAVNRAIATIPRYTDFQDKIMADIAGPDMQAYLADHPEYRTDPQKMYALLEAATSRYVWHEYVTNQQAAQVASGGEPAPETTTSKPRTQQRSKAAPPTSDDEVMGMFPAGTFRAGN
jgi:predicted transcriptional regulator